jgi:hypothetical protein
MMKGLGMITNNRTVTIDEWHSLASSSLLGIARLNIHILLYIYNIFG